MANEARRACIHLKCFISFQNRGRPHYTDNPMIGIPGPFTDLVRGIDGGKEMYRAVVSDSLASMSEKGQVKQCGNERRIIMIRCLKSLSQPFLGR